MHQNKTHCLFETGNIFNDTMSELKPSKSKNVNKNVNLNDDQILYDKEVFDDEPNLENARAKPERMSVSRTGRCKTLKERRRSSIFDISGVDENDTEKDNTDNVKNVPHQNTRQENDNECSKTSQLQDQDRTLVHRTDQNVTSFEW